MDILNPVTRYLTAAKCIGIGLLLAVLAWQTYRAETLGNWRADVIMATAFAIDADASDATVPKVVSRDVAQHIRNLGTFKRDVLRLREAARADDAQNIINTGRKVVATNQEQSSEFKLRIAGLDRVHSSLVAQRLLRGGSAAIGNSGGRGETGLPGVSDASSRIDGPAEADEFPPSCPQRDEWNLAERYEASVYATQLDQLISANEALAKIDPNGVDAK